MVTLGPRPSRGFILAHVPTFPKAVGREWGNGALAFKSSTHHWDTWLLWSHFISQSRSRPGLTSEEQESAALPCVWWGIRGWLFREHRYQLPQWHLPQLWIDVHFHDWFMSASSPKTIVAGKRVLVWFCSCLHLWCSANSRHLISTYWVHYWSDCSQVTSLDLNPHLANINTFFQITVPTFEFYPLWPKLGALLSTNLCLFVCFVNSERVQVGILWLIHVTVGN